MKRSQREQKHEIKVHDERGFARDARVTTLITPFVRMWSSDGRDRSRSCSSILDPTSFPNHPLFAVRVWNQHLQSQIDVELFRISHIQHHAHHTATTLCNRTWNISVEKWASHLDSDSSLSPMSSLWVVSVAESLLAFCLWLYNHILHSHYLIFPSFKLRWVIVPDSVTGSQSNPLRKWSVLFLRFGELNLRTESLVALWNVGLVLILLFIDVCA